MTAFSEKADKVLKFLEHYGIADWNALFIATGITEQDPIINHLIRKFGFIRITKHDIQLTQLGKDFISSTTFVEIREIKKAVK